VKNAGEWLGSAKDVEDDEGNAVTEHKLQMFCILEHLERAHDVLIVPEGNCTYDVVLAVAAIKVPKASRRISLITHLVELRTMKSVTYRT